jgi:hypothetical protein
MSQDNSTQIPILKQDQLEATANLFAQAPELAEENPQYQFTPRAPKGRRYKHAKFVHVATPSLTSSALFGEAAKKFVGAKGTYCKRCINGK